MSYRQLAHLAAPIVTVARLMQERLRANQGAAAAEMIEGLAQPHTATVVRSATTPLGDVTLWIETEGSGALSLLLPTPVASDLMDQLQLIFAPPRKH